jgi:hypothetical protein
VTCAPAAEISSGIHALEDARVTIENSALGTNKGRYILQQGADQGKQIVTLRMFWHQILLDIGIIAAL